MAMSFGFHDPKISDKKLSKKCMKTDETEIGRRWLQQ